jgi:hypothetical protein
VSSYKNGSVVFAHLLASWRVNYRRIGVQHFKFAVHEDAAGINPEFP